ncbi:TfoX N-terminal domain-containing protein [Pseudovibrio ascidiaceicola]|uniref:TfoX N-terminal domain-containing protein n=1 Tax=Pseudovibrio ascidiaceicola TaxID=285279 RepID=A0A1I3V1Z4_9HYPH|nr:TfoX/Sxy family protein [Pseudovibrio ascidiaceicola]SFJ88187.1 TfoX N-terminal domain-containing protein [Pseudovibrio ascidiaceicola]
MAYDEELSDRLREELEGIMGISEKRMMGGLCFFLDGNMLAGAHRIKSEEARFMFRVGKGNEAEALGRDGAEIVELGGRRMGGLVFVAAEMCDQAALREWISLSMSFVAGLPAKQLKGKG